MRPTVGIRTLTPNAVKSKALFFGLMKADFTVMTMQAIVNNVIILMKMYLQKMKGPQAYLYEMYGYVLPRKSKAMPQ